MGLHRVEIKHIVDKKEGYRSMAIPSMIHSYSVCLEYLRKWFLGHFQENFFDSADGTGLYIAGRHAFDDFRKQAVGGFKTTEKMIGRMTNSASLSCRINMEYDRDKIDMYPFGTELYLKRHSTALKPFFEDKVNNLNLAQDFEIMELQATFKMEFRTKALQADMYKYCQMAFRIGATQGEYIDYEQHVPYCIMLQIAKDNGFNTANGKIVDIMAFLKYLNMNSYIPFLYKFRNINGNDEFFVKVKNVYVHIAIPEIEADDGEKTGQSTEDYALTFTANVRFPITKCYIYFSENKHTEIVLKEPIEGNVACFTTIRMIDAPDYNEKRWKKMFSTEYEDDSVTDEITTIDMSELILVEDLGRIIRATTNINLSPEMFMDIKFFNNNEQVPFNINWVTGKCTSFTALKSTRTTIVVYIDMDYVNQQVLTLDKITSRSRLG